jgi:predicted metal-binding membrane protein
MLETAARNERWIVLAALLTVAAIGLFLTLRAGDGLMSATSGTAAYMVLLFVMWLTMMLAMMLPSAAPAILTYAALGHKLAAKGTEAAPPLLFASGYILIWAGFSAAAVVLQIVTERWVPLTGMMAVTSATVGGALLIAAGLYQLSPLKYACLKKCQMPLMYFARNWRKGHLGAVSMGLSHGIYCLGFCWVLMGVLFYGGVMEVTWIVGLAVYIAAEKLIPAESKLSQVTGMALIGWGVWVVARTLVH